MNTFTGQTPLAYTIAFAAALLAAVILTPLFRLIALRLNILDHPHSNIKTHRTPVPYLGGLAIWAGWVAGITVIRFLTHFPTGTLRSLRGILIGSTIVLILGFIDDVIPKGLSYKHKFFFQALAALIVIFFDIRLHFVSPYFVALILSVIWVIGITNAFNIIDIMDGLSSGIAMIASLAFLFIALPTEQIYVNVCAAALAGACLGFIPFNLSTRGKIFMGDTGSLSLGFILAALSLGTSYTKLNNIGIFAPILILAIPIYDTLLVMYLRWRRGMSPFLGSKDHFALRLEKLGYNRRQILAITYIASSILAFGAFFVTRLSMAWATALFLSIFFIAVLVSIKLSKVKIE